MQGSEVLCTIAASVAVHLVVFFVLRGWLSARLFGRLYSKLSEYDRLRWNERSVALLHAVVSAQGAIRALVALAPAYPTISDLAFGMCAPATPSMDLGEWYLCVTLGYFLYDSVLMATVARHHGTADWVHHIVSGGQYAVMVAYRFAYIVPIALQTNEVSTPFMHLSWFLGKAQDHGFLGSAPQRIAMACFAALFFLSRVLFDTALFALSLYVVAGRFCPAEIPRAVQFVSILAMVAYMGVQYMWFVFIVRKLVAELKSLFGVKKIQQQPKKDAKKVN